MRITPVSVTVRVADPPKRLSDAVTAPPFDVVPGAKGRTKAKPLIDLPGSQGRNSPGVHINGPRREHRRPLINRRRIIGHAALHEFACVPRAVTKKCHQTLGDLTVSSGTAVDYDADCRDRRPD